MGLLKRLFGSSDRGSAPQLYAAVIARGREPHWYVEGAVSDSIDGRFDMIAAVLAVVLLRLEGNSAGVATSTALAECFIDDMDGQLREIGIGDIVVGKHVGHMMGMLGGRLDAYRAGFAAGTLAPALERNLYRGRPPLPDAVAHVERSLRALRATLDATPLDILLKGELPR